MDHVSSFTYLATTNPDPPRAVKRKPPFNTVYMARPLALARMDGGMILSKPSPGSITHAKGLFNMHIPIVSFCLIY